MNDRGFRRIVWVFVLIFCLWPEPLVAQMGGNANLPVGLKLGALRTTTPNRAMPLAGSSLAPLALRTGALFTTELDLVGLTLNLPATPIQLPQNAPFYLPVTLTMGGKAATPAQAQNLYPATAVLRGTLTGPGLGAPVALTGTLGQGLSVQGLPQAGDYTVSNVQLVQDGKVLLNASPATCTVTCLGEILLSSVTSTPMTMQEIQNAGIPLKPGDYIGRNFEMVLAVSGQTISLNLPVAIPVYNGLPDPRDSGGGPSGMSIGSISSSQPLPPGLSLVVADIVPPKDPFTLSRPELSFQLNNNFKAILVVPGSIGFLKQIYKVNVMVFNALDAASPYKVTHLSAQWVPPAGLDGLVGTTDDPLQPTGGEALVQDLLGPDGATPVIGGGQSAFATFTMVGNREGSHPLDFVLSGQFEGGDLTTPVPITGHAQGKVLVQNATFNLMLVHPDVVRRGQTYTLEAHLTNSSQTLANGVSLTIDNARLAGATLVGDATQRVDTILPGDTVVMKFQLQALISGQITSSYLYIDTGATIGFQLSTGIGSRGVTLNPDTLSLPDSLSGLPQGLRDAMLALLNAAYDVSTSQAALPTGVLPISRSTITTSMASSLSQEGLFMAMGLDKTRIWWDLWTLFMMNPDSGFDQLVRVAPEGAQFRAALLDAWQTWAAPSQGLADHLPSLGSYGYGVTTGGALVAIQGGAPGLGLSVSDAAGQEVQGAAGSPVSLPQSWSAWGASTDSALQLAQAPMTGAGKLILTNSGAAQTVRMAVLSPVAGQNVPAVNTFDLTLQPGDSATFGLGGSQSRVQGQQGATILQPSSSVPALAPEPFQVLGVHRYDLSVSGTATPAGTQVMVLFNRPNMPLQIPDGDDGFQAATRLITVEANQFWRKAMPPSTDGQGGVIVDAKGNPVVPPSPAALIQAYPRVVSCYIEKPVGPYVNRTLTLDPSWTDANNNAIQGSLAWPIQSGLLPGGAIVKGHFRKLDGTGVSGNLTYWYQEFVNNPLAIDLESGLPFVDEVDETYYALITNNVATDADGGFQLDYVPAPYGDFIGPFVLQGGFTGGTAFAQASVLGNGQVVQMDLVLEGSGSVEGHVLDASGQPIPGVALMAIQEQRSSDFTRGTAGGSFTVSGVTDAAGHYRLDGLKTGIFCVQALKGELGAVSGGQITSDGQVATVDILLQGKTGTLKAHVLDAQGNVRMDQAVRLGIPGGLVRNAGSAYDWVYPREQRPGSDGWATFTTVPAGDVQIIAPYSAPTPAPAWQGFLNGGDTQQVELRMVDSTQMATVQALVKDAAGNPVSGAYLKFDNLNWTPFAAQTRADGTTPAIQSSPGQTLTGYVYHPNWVGYYATNSVTTQPGGTYVLSAVLPLRCTLSGTVSRPDGTPAARAYVAIPPVFSDMNQNRLCITDSNGAYAIKDIPVGAAYRLCAVGPELLTAVSQSFAVKGADTALSINLTLPAVGANTLTGRVFQPPTGNGQDIPTKATVVAYGQLPDVATGTSDGGNTHWGLPQTVVTGGISESGMSNDPAQTGFFTLKNLPAGPYSLTASSDLNPTTVSVTGDFGPAVLQTDQHNLYLKGNDAGAIQGRILLPDGQTPVAAGARVMIMSGSDVFLQVLSQPGGTYAFAKVVPPSPFTLRVEDPVTGYVYSQSLWLGPQEVRTLPIRLWGTGNLTVLVQDSDGNPLPYGTVTLQHSKSSIASASDMPILQLPVTPADNGTLLFPHLLEGPVNVLLKNPTGLSGLASATLPVGGGDRTVIVRLQPVGRIKGRLFRADGTLVAAGRVDAYQGGNWLGTSPTYQENTPGEFLFDPLPAGAIQLEAWDPDSRQTGNASVTVQADQTTALDMTTLDTGPVTIQVLQEGQPVLRAGITVSYRGGPALAFSTQATGDLLGTATFTLPPGTYDATATDPVSLAGGQMTFTRGINDPALSETLSVQPVRTVQASGLPPATAPGIAAPSLSGWRVTASGVNRSAVLDANNQATLQEMPVGAYTLYLSDAQGRSRGSQPFQVTQDGGAVQVAQVQAQAYGNLQVTVTDAGGNPVAGASVGADGAGQRLFTDTKGQVHFYGIEQGTRNAYANLGAQSAYGTYTLSTEGQLATASLAFAPTASLHGRVLDPFGKPVPFISVSCGGLVADTATDADGAFAFQSVPTGRTFTVVATTAQGRMAVSSPVTLMAGDDPAITLSLQAVGSLDGILTDPLRPTLPSLGITVLDGSTVLATAATDQTGAFHIPTLPAGRPLTLRALWDDGATVALQQTFTIPGQGQDLNLALTIPPFVDITGWTQDAAGANSPMYVQLQDAQGNLLARATTTVDIPTFFFHYVKAGQTFRLEGFDEYTGLPVALAFITPVGQTRTEVYSLQMAPRPSLALQLRYPDGSPAPGSGVLATVTGTGYLGGQWTGSFDGSGLLTLPAVNAGSISIAVLRLPWQDDFTFTGQVSAQPGIQSLDIPVRGLGSLSAQVVNAAARNVTGGTVSLSVAGKTLAGVASGAGFSWPQVPIGVPLTLVADGFALGIETSQTVTPLTVQGESRAVVLNVPSSGAVAGQLLDADGKALPGTTIQLFLNDAPKPVMDVLTDASGAFLVTGLPLATGLKFYVQDPDFDFAVARATLALDQQTVTVSMQKHGLGTLQASASRFKGAPLAGIALTLSQTDAPTLTAVTDATGAASFPTVPAGMAWNAKATLPIKGSVAQSVTVPRGQTGQVSFTDQAFTRLVGPLQRVSGQGFPSGSLLAPAGGSAVAVAANGAFTPVTLALPDGVTASNIGFSINGTSLGSWLQALTVDGDTLVTQAPAFGVLSAAVLKRDGATPAPNVALTLDGVSAGATDANGLWSRDGQSLGTHHLVAASPYGQAQGDQSLVSDGATATFNLKIQPAIQITLTPATANLLVGGSQPFVATVTGTDRPGVTWTLQEGAAGGSISTSGVYQAPAVAGLFHVIATSVDDPSKSATAVVKVKNLAPLVITVAPSTISILPGASASFNASVTGADNANVIWTIQEGPAGGSITAGGIYTAPAQTGSYHVVATSVADPTQSIGALVVVSTQSAGKVSGVFTTDQGGLTLYQVGTAVNGTWINGSGTSIQVTGTLVGQVVSGTWTAPSLSDQGQFVLTFSLDGSAFQGTWGRLTSELGTSWNGTLQAGVVSVQLSPASLILKLGDAFAFSVQVAGAPSQAVTWSATGGDIASNGVYTAPFTPGLYTITATSAADPSKSASSTVVVGTTGNLEISGIYQTNDGALVLYQNGSAIQGTWTETSGLTKQLQGSLAGTSLSGTWAAPATSDQGQFEVNFTSDGLSFSGNWGRLASELGSAWTGARTQGAIAVSLAPASAILTTGQSMTFQAQVGGSFNKAIVWSATGGTISPDGTYVAPAQPGLYTVTATSVADGTVSATATLAVSANGTLGIGYSYLTNNGTVAFFQNGPSIIADWKDAGGNLFQYQGLLDGTILSGSWTEPSTADHGLFALTFSQDGSSFQGTSGRLDSQLGNTLSGSVIPGAVSVHLAPALTVLSPGGTQGFQGMVSGATDQSLNWSIAEGAAGGTIDASGFYTAPMATGIYHVSACSPVDATRIATVTVQVTGSGLLQVAGTYTSNWGGFVLYQSGATVTGSWSQSSYGNSQIIGTLVGGILNGAWQSDGGTSGQVSLTFSPDGLSCNGSWGFGVSNNYSNWNATRAGGLVSILVSPASAVLAPGQNLAFVASVAGTGDAGIIWSNTGGTLTPDGHFTAPAEPGLYAVTATSHADPTKQASATIIVTASGVLDIAGTYGGNWGSLVLYQSGSAITGTWAQSWYGNTQITGTITNRVLTGAWKADGGQGGQFCLPFSSDGMSFAGSWGFNAANNYSNWSGTRSSGLVTVMVGPTSFILAPGQSQALTAAVAGSFDSAVAWTTTAGTITPDGILTAPGTPGLYTVTATAHADPTKSATATFQVTPTGVLHIAATFSSTWGGIVFYQSGATVKGTWAHGWYGNTEITGTLTGNVLAGSWKSDSGTGGSFLLTFTPNGLSFSGGWGFGTSTSYTTWSGTQNTGVVSVVLDPLVAVLVEGQSLSFVAQVAGSFDTSVVWSATGGTISPSGVYTAPATAGTYAITVFPEADPTKTATATVIVTPDGLLDMGGTYATNWGNIQFFQSGALVTGGWGHAWYGNAQIAASLSGRNLAGTWTCPGGTGGQFLVAFSMDGQSFSGSWGFGSSNNYSNWSGNRVAGAPGIQITPATVNLSPGQTQVFVGAIAGLADDRATWAASGGALTAGGTYTAPSLAGTYTVTATSLANPALSATATIQVVPSLVVSPATTTLPPGASALFSATIFGLQDSSVIWSVQEIGGGSISADGTYTAPPSPGTYHVIAVSNADRSLTFTSRITVGQSFLAPDLHLPFDEGTGSVAADASGHERTATVANGATWTPGRFGNALSFQGNASAMVILNPPFSLGTDWTLTGWLQTPLPATGAGHDMIHGPSNDALICIGGATDDYLGTYRSDNGTFYDTGFRLSTLPSGWHLLAAVGSGGATTFYVDGAQAGQPVPWQSQSPIYSIGNHSSGGHAVSAVDDVRIFRRALGAMDIAGLAGQGVCVTPSTLFTVKGATGSFLANVPGDPSNGVTWTLPDATSGLLDPAGVYSAPAPSGIAWFQVSAESTAEPGLLGSAAVQVGNLALGLQGAWAFDDGSGSTVQDASGLGHDGSLMGAVAWLTGLRGGALGFNGSGSSVAIPSLDPFAGAFSVAAWVKFNQVNRGIDNAILGFGATSPNAGLHMTERGSKAYFGFYENDVTGNTTLPANQWLHLAFIFDGRQKLIYVNGVLDAIQDSTPFIGTGFNLTLGAYPWITNPNQGSLSGALDEVRVFDRALNPGEVLALATPPQE